MSAASSSSSATANPSSMTNAAESHIGRAPWTARSFTVPCTARWPMRAAREPARLHDVGVGGEGQPLAARQQADGGVVGRARWPAEALEEHVVDERRRRLAAGAMGEGHHLVVEAGPAPPERLDPVEHLVLAGVAAVGVSHGPAAPAWSSTAAHRAKPSAAWASWMRWMLSAATTRQWWTCGERAISPPS